MNTAPQNPTTLSRKALLVACLAAALLPGCGAGGSKEEPLVIVVGDRTVGDVVTELGRLGLPASTDKSRFTEANLIVIAQEAAGGPMPQHRGLVQEIAATGNQNVMWLLTNALGLDDPELLALVRTEVRELLYSYGFPGNAIPIGIDKEPFPIDPKLGYLVGWSAISSYLKGLR